MTDAPKKDRNMPLEKWETLNSRTIHRDRWLSLRADTCRSADGRLIDPYYVLEYPDWVHVIALDPAGRILIIRQYRHGAGILSVEFPAGEIEAADESPLEAAQRELLEETGCRADRFEALEPLFTNPARQGNRIHTYVAFETVEVQEPAFDETEEIEHWFVSPADLLRHVDKGLFSQALHVASLMQIFRRFPEVFQ